MPSLFHCHQSRIQLSICDRCAFKAGVVYLMGFHGAVYDDLRRTFHLFGDQLGAHTQTVLVAALNARIRRINIITRLVVAWENNFDSTSFLDLSTANYDRSPSDGEGG